ncbi:hypothetical protein GUJ93_ZPchr0003g16889 [Zizania palustris]|uniref:Uncharacterized protein n=1 Tax=Zizania palustris TaxID=103762 RepID=A0A8J5SA55_ZIZPA|nr:hypothetical protein GUJ93_ZPchr0003g16889 [Zizania palustris]
MDRFYPRFPPSPPDPVLLSAASLPQLPHFSGARAPDASLPRSRCLCAPNLPPASPSPAHASSFRSRPGSGQMRMLHQ